MNNSESKVSILVKFCGGCNPFYDRVALVEKIADSLKGKAELVYSAGDGVDMVLAVHGCETACADLSAFQGLEIRSITTPEEGAKVIQEIHKMTGKMSASST